MRYSIIENNVVVNIAIADEPQAANWRQDDNAGIGWVDVDGVLTAPTELPPVSLVPTVLTMRQARLVLFTAGLIGSVQAAIDALPSPDKEKAQIEWDYSNEVQRHNGFVSQLAPALGLTDEQVDALFITGAVL